MFACNSRELSSCMIVGSSISYHSMKQCRILHENLGKFFAKAIEWRYLCGWIRAQFGLVRGVRAFITCKSTLWSTCVLQGSARCPNLQTQVRPMVTTDTHTVTQTDKREHRNLDNSGSHTELPLQDKEEEI